MFIIKHKWIFITISAILAIAAIVVIAIKGFNIGIDFTGGSVVEVSYENRPSLEEVKEALSDFDFEAQTQAFGEKGYIIRTRVLSEEERGTLLEALTINKQDPQLERFNTIGPSIGKELRTKAILALVIVMLAIVLFIAYVFRKNSEPVSSWKYGLIAVVALIHDVVIPAGIFSLLDLEVNALFIVGLLSILGTSVHDTIVVFDRIRENLNVNKAEKKVEAFPITVGKSIGQTFTRSINTSLTILIVLIVLYFVGPSSTQNLALVLFLGTFFGTYSSIALASPLLVIWNKNK